MDHLIANQKETLARPTDPRTKTILEKQLAEMQNEQNAIATK